MKLTGVVFEDGGGGRLVSSVGQNTENWKRWQGGQVRGIFIVFWSRRVFIKCSRYHLSIFYPKFSNMPTHINHLLNRLGLNHS